MFGLSCLNSLNCLFYVVHHVSDIFSQVLHATEIDYHIACRVQGNCGEDYPLVKGGHMIAQNLCQSNMPPFRDPGQIYGT